MNKLLKTASLALAVFLMVFFSSCAPTEFEDSISGTNSSLPLPENLSIECDTDTLSYPTEAKTYSAQLWDAPSAPLQETLLHYPILHKEDYAEGPSYFAGNKEEEEQLIIYDGIRLGGFVYYYLPENELYTKLSHYCSSEPCFFSTGLPFISNWNYGSGDLDFEPKVSVENTLLSLFSSIGVSMKVSQSYSMDVASLERQGQLEKEYLETHNGEYTPTSWKKEEEAYHIFFRQMVEDLPIADMDWFSGIATNQESPHTYGEAMYGKDGLINLSVSSLFEVGTPGKTVPIISPTAALDSLIDGYRNVELKQETQILSCELVYVPLKKEDCFSLEPAWVFFIRTDEDYFDATTQAIQHDTEYVYRAIHAESGKLLLPGGGEAK